MAKTTQLEILKVRPHTVKGIPTKIEYHSEYSVNGDWPFDGPESTIEPHTRQTTSIATELNVEDFDMAINLLKELEKVPRLLRFEMSIKHYKWIRRNVQTTIPVSDLWGGIAGTPIHIKKYLRKVRAVFSDGHIEEIPMKKTDKYEEVRL